MQICSVREFADRSAGKPALSEVEGRCVTQGRGGGRAAFCVFPGRAGGVFFYAAVWGRADVGFLTGASPRFEMTIRCCGAGRGAEAPLFHVCAGGRIRGANPPAVWWNIGDGSRR